MKWYRLTSEPTYEFFTGRNAEGLQIIAGRDWNAFVAIYFDKEGNCLHHYEQPFNHLGERSDELTIESPYIQLSNEAHENLNKVFQQWLAETITQPDSVVVKVFNLESRYIFIEEMPFEYQDFLDDPSSFNEDDTRRLTQSIEKWREQKLYIFNWGNDFWIDGYTGEVHSS